MHNVSADLFSDFCLTGNIPLKQAEKEYKDKLK